MTPSTYREHINAIKKKPIVLLFCFFKHYVMHFEIRIKTTGSLKSSSQFLKDGTNHNII